MKAPAKTEDRLVSRSLVFFCIFLGAVSVLALNATTIISFVFNDYQQNLVELNDKLVVGSDSFITKINSFPITATLVTIIAWFIIGIVVFSAAQGIIRYSSEIKEDVNTSFFYVHPEHFKKGHYWFAILLRSFFVLFVLSFTALWLLLSIRVFIPFSSITFLLGLDALPQLAKAIGFFLVSIGTLSLLFFGFIVLYRILKAKVF